MNTMKFKLPPYVKVLKLIKLYKLNDEKKSLLEFVHGKYILSLIFCSLNSLYISILGRRRQQMSLRI